MPLSRKFCVGFLLVASLMAEISSSSAATYSYIGNSFTTFTAEGVPISNADAAFAAKSISGEFTLPSALGTGFNGVVNPTEFSFSGALIPLTNPTSYSFDIQTSDTGAIIGWMISIGVSGGPASIGIFTGNAGDSSSSSGPTTFIEGSNSVRGTWSVTATPIPASLLLFATGLGILALLRCSRTRKAI